MYINKAIVFGNLTRDPEKAALPNGDSVTKFNVATNRPYKTKDGEKREQTEFHNVVAFGKVADIIAQYMRKGGGIFVEGRLQTRSWETDGVKKFRTEIVVERFQFGPSGERAEKEETEEDPLAGEFPPDEGINPEDIPF